MSIINPSMSEKGKSSDVEIADKKRCEKIISVCKIKMTIEKQENNVGNYICRGDESIDSRSNSEE